MIFEIKKDRDGKPYGLFSCSGQPSIRIDPAMVDVKLLQLLIAYFATYTREVIQLIEQQVLYCHECGQYVHFPIDLSLNGNHVLECPSCGHEHCRVVKDGMITDFRWDQRNGPTIPVSTTSATSSSFSQHMTFGTGTGSCTASIYTTSTFQEVL